MAEQIQLQLNLETNADDAKRLGAIKKELTGIDEASEGLDGVNQSMTSLSSGFEGAADGAKLFNLQNTAVGKTLSTVNTVVLGAQKAFRGFTASVSTTSGALKLLRVALISTGIGAIVVAVGALAAAFVSTQRGVDALNSVLRPLQAVLSRVWGIMQDIASFIVDGEWRQAINAITSFGTEIKQAAQEGRELAEAQIAIEQANISWIETEAKLNKELAEKRLLIRDETIALEDRQQAAEDALAILEEREKEELALLDQRIEQMEREQALNDTSREDEKELAELRANRLQVEERLANEQRTLQRDLIRLENEREKEAKAREDAIQEREQRRIDHLEELAEARRETLQRMDDEIFEEDIDFDIETEDGEELIIFNGELMTRTQMEIMQEKGSLALIQNLQGRAITKEEFNIGALELEKSRIEAELEIAEEGSKRHIELQRELAEAEVDIENAKSDAKIALFEKTGEALMNLSRLAGEQTAIGKALGIVSATIDTYVGANKALAQGGIFGIVSAASVIATGLANVRQILSTEVPSIQGQPLGTPAQSPGGQARPATPPEFNETGVNTVNTVQSERDRADANRPVKAVVVETDITETQNRVNEIERQASF